MFSIVWVRSAILGAWTSRCSVRCFLLSEFFVWLAPQQSRVRKSLTALSLSTSAFLRDKRPAATSASSYLSLFCKSSAIPLLSLMTLSWEFLWRLFSFLTLLTAAAESSAYLFKALLKSYRRARRDNMEFSTLLLLACMVATFPLRYIILSSSSF